MNYEEILQEIENLATGTMSYSNSNLCNVEFKRPEEMKETFGQERADNDNHGNTISPSSSTISAPNDDIISMLSDIPVGYFHDDIGMKGYEYDLEAFGFRWKLQSVQTLYGNEIRNLQVLVPYDINGFPKFSEWENDNNENETKKENEYVEVLIPDFLNSCETVENVIVKQPEFLYETITGLGDNANVNKESKEFEIENMAPEFESEVEIIESDDKTETSGMGVIAMNAETSLVPKNFTPKSIQRFNFDGQSCVAQWEQDTITNQNFAPARCVNRNEEIVLNNYTSSNSESLFVCQFCNHGFQQKYKWKNHVRIHFGQVTYKCSCERCGVPYRDYRTMRKNHNDRYRKIM